MRFTLLACLAGVLALGLASCKCGDAVEQTGGPDDATKQADGKAAQPEGSPTSEPGEQVVCPVCGLRFGAEEATATHEHDGETYHFLLEDHKDAFAADPTSYLDRPTP
jgi:YHS domain-containing protein